MVGMRMEVDMECNFFVGQKVVCVDANGASRFTGSTTPWEPDEQISDGEIYTITSVHLFHGLIVLHLQEVQRSISARMLWGPLAGYGAYRFRPVTDISDLKKIVSEVFTKKPASVSA